MSGFWKPASVSHKSLDEADSDDFVLQASFTRSRAPLCSQRLLLPIYKYKKLILYSIEQYQVIVIVGDTGSGKSTQLPQYLMENGWADNGFCIVCTQPRRIAATTLAQRVAEEVGCSVGTRVGYSVRFDSKPGSQINYVTDGMLLREATLADPLLSKYSVVIVDEAHERSINSDTVLGLLKKICRKRKDLRVIICSATIDAQSFLDFFVDPQNAVEGNRKKRSRWGEPLAKNEPVPSIKEESVKTISVTGKGTIISVDGRQYPVDVLYLAQPAQNHITKMIETIIAIHRDDKTMGDILCFLASAEDIDYAIRLAEDELEHEQSSMELLPLYGSLPYHMQARVFQPREGNTQVIRRVIFATNIAECSVT
jgi:ATP-dependent RNA helicase DDX35